MQHAIATFVVHHGMNVPTLMKHLLALIVDKQVLNLKKLIYFRKGEKIMVKKSQKIIVKIDGKDITSVYMSNYVPGQGLISNVIQRLYFLGITDKAELIGSAYPHDINNPTDDIILYYESKK